MESASHSQPLVTTMHQQVVNNQCLNNDFDVQRVVAGHQSYVSQAQRAIVLFKQAHKEIQKATH
jgi:hypothetical protein